MTIRQVDIKAIDPVSNINALTAAGTITNDARITWDDAKPIQTTLTAIEKMKLAIIKAHGSLSLD